MESAVQGDVEKSIKGSVGVEVRGVKNVRWNRCKGNWKLGLARTSRRS